MRLAFFNARKYGDDESYVTWGLIDDGEALDAFESYRLDVRADCYRAEGHGEEDDDDCEYCQVYINDEFEIVDGQVIVAQSGKRYRIVMEEVEEA